jgi:ribosomal protein S18 acetylase RimI-like enzyme
MNNYTIKLVTASDNLENLIQTIKNSQWSSRSEIDPQDYSLKNLEKFILLPHNIFITAFEGEDFVGMASAHILTKTTGDVWLYIDEVDVVENMHKKGVGRHLMQYLIEFATQNNCHEVWLGTETDNIAANRLYQSLNPDEVSEFVGYTYTIHN